MGTASLWSEDVLAVQSSRLKSEGLKTATGASLTPEGEAVLARLTQWLKSIEEEGRAEGVRAKQVGLDVQGLTGVKQSSLAMLSIADLAEQLPQRPDDGVRDVLIGVAPELALLLSQTLLGVEKVTAEPFSQVQSHLRTDAQARIQVHGQLEELVTRLPLQPWRRRRVLKQLKRTLEQVEQESPTTVLSRLRKQRDRLLVEAERVLEQYGPLPGLQEPLEVFRQRAEVQTLAERLRALLAPELRAVQYGQGNGWYDYGGETFLGLKRSQLLVLALALILVIVAGILVLRWFFIALLPLLVLIWFVCRFPAGPCPLFP